MYHSLLRKKKNTLLHYLYEVQGFQNQNPVANVKTITDPHLSLIDVHN